MSRPHLMLIGGGHAHLPLLRQTRRLLAAGCQVTLISEPTTWYSGMATGVLGGVYAIGANCIDVAAFCRHVGATFIPGHVQVIDHAAQHVVHEDGTRLHYDVLSIDIGSGTAMATVSGAQDHAIQAKPLVGLDHARRRCETLIRAGQRCRIVVVGGGMSGGEIALSAATLVGSRGEVHWCAKHHLAMLPTPARARVMALAQQRGVRVHCVTITAIDQQQVRGADGFVINCDVVLQATGLQPVSLGQRSGLPLSADGAIQITSTLAVTGHANIFAAGDCAHMESQHLPRLGVVAVRQAACLGHNLIAAAWNRPLISYRPQTRWLSIVNLGAGMGLALWGTWWWRGRLAWWVKDTIDRRFMASFR